MKKPSILFYNFGARLGGAEIVLLKFLQQTPDGLTFKVLLNEYGTFYDRLVEHDISVDVIETQAKHFYSVKREDAISLKFLQLVPASIQLFFRVIRYFRQHKFDLIVSNTFKSHLILGLASKLFGFKGVWRFHDIIQQKYEYNQFSSLTIFLMKLVMPDISKVITVSQAVTDSFLDFDFHPSKFSVVHNGLDVRQPKSDTRVVNTDTIRVGWIGQFTAWKGIEEYVKLCKAIIDAKDRIGKPLEFVMAGSALFGNEDYEQQIKAMITEEYRRYFTFLGHLSDTDSFYQGIHVYFHTSIAPDPFPTTILEAGSHGLLVFASELGGAGEIIEDRVTGYLINMTDEQKTLDTAIQVLTNFSEERGKGFKLQQRISVDLNTDIYRHRLETELLKTIAD